MAVLGCSGDPGDGGSAPNRATRGEGPSLLIITIDTWRWDYIGASGAGRVKTPTLDRLASEGLYEPKAVSPCPLTTPAHASLFTGLRPINHGVLDCTSFELAEGLPTTAEAFAARGYKTAAFVSSETLRKRFGLDRGFDVYDDSGVERRPDMEWLAGTKDGALTTAASIRYLQENGGSDPLFLWVHYFDCHTPYRPRPEYDALYPDDRYGAQVAFVDDQVAALMESIGSQKDREWRVVVVGDHGEGLGDHGEFGHGFGLYGSTLDVPLIIHPAPERPLLHPRPWCLLDLDPTLREWFAIPALPLCDGRSLFVEGSPGRTLACQTFLPSFVFHVNPTLGVRRENLMYIRHGKEELYDLDTDPLEEKNVAGEKGMGESLEALRRDCREAFPPGRIDPLLVPTLGTTADELENLRGLGYVGGLVESVSDLQRVDLHEFLRDYNDLDREMASAQRSGDYEALKARYRTTLQKYPQAAAIYKDYGQTCLKTGDVDGAIAAYEQALRLNPKDPHCLYILGTQFMTLKEVDKAKVLLEALVELQPDHADAHKQLGALYAYYLDDTDKSRMHNERYLELTPDDREDPAVRAALSPEWRGNAPSLLLVTVSGLGTESLKGKGKSTPNLDHLKNGGLREDGLVSPYPLPGPSHASIHTGLGPLTHGVVGGWRNTLPESAATLAERFKKAGYRTAGIISNRMLNRGHGFHRGFGYFDDRCMLGPNEPNEFRGTQDGALTTASALEYLGRGNTPGPVFLWVHYNDLEPPIRKQAEEVVRRGDGTDSRSLGFVDSQIGLLLKYLQKDKDRDWRVVVLGDHGPGLEQVDPELAGLQLSNSSISVPMVLYPKPDRILQHGRPWGIIDVAPTLLDWMGLNADPAIDGESLFSAGTPDRKLSCFTLAPAFDYGTNPCFGVRGEKYLYLRHSIEELYEPDADPRQKDNLAVKEGAGSLLQPFKMASVGTYPAERMGPLLDRPVAPKVQALLGVKKVALQRADINELMEKAANLYETAAAAKGLKENTALKPRFERFLAEYPNSPVVQAKFGSLLRRLRERDGATKAYEAAVLLNPLETSYLSNLAALYTEKERYDDAMTLLEVALKVGGDAIAHRNLAVLYKDHKKQPHEAVKHFREYLRLDPRARDAKRVQEYIDYVEGGGAGG